MSSLLSSGLLGNCLSANSQMEYERIMREQMFYAQQAAIAEGAGRQISRKPETDPVILLLPKKLA